MNVEAIRGWLMVPPRPKAVRVSSEGSEPQRIDVPEGSAWINIAKSIGALQPDLVEALTAEGGTIRAMRPAELGADDDDDEADDGADVVVQDPESARLIIFARLIASAYEHSTNVAFDKMVQLFEASSRRQESLERSLELTQKILTKTAADQLQQQVDEAAGVTSVGGGTLLEQMLAAFLQGKAQAAEKTAAANGANGATKSEAPQ
jgi:hypothetical protein